MLINIRQVYSGPFSFIVIKYQHVIHYMNIKRISGVTLAVKDMKKSVDFYANVLGLRMLYGGSDASFTSFDVGGTFLNLEAGEPSAEDWGRIIFHVDSVDKLFDYMKNKGFKVNEPRNAYWGERFFHASDPDGHELSFAQPITV